MKKLLIFLFVASLLFARSYILKNDVLDAGGEKMTNANYILRSSFGQFTVGNINNASYGAIIGFWNPWYSPPSFPSGWVRLESLPTQAASKYVKDGAALAGMSGSKYAVTLFAIRGNKSNEFYKYVSGTPGNWIRIESIPYGKKPTDTTKINKKKIGKGGALCYDGDVTIYATKGNGTKEFWAYDVTQDTWIAKKPVPVPKGLKGGTSIFCKDAKVYLLAGSQKTSDSVNFYVYDVSTDVWSPLSCVPLTPRTKAWKDGSCISGIGNTIYALKGGDKHNYFWSYDIALGTWTEKETLPAVHPDLGKKNITKDGGALTTDGTVFYAIKGGGKQDFWFYTPGIAGTWTPLDTIPKLNKKSVPKTGAALAYTVAVFLLKGNNTDEFWRYVSTGVKATGTTPTTYTAEMIEQTMSAADFNFEVRPNPFTKFATIRYSVPIAGEVSIKLYNTTGRLVEVLNDGYVNAGNYTIHLSARQLAKGVYFLEYEDDRNKNEIKVIVR